MHEKLRFLRNQKKITQQELANILGLDRTSVTKYETGHSIPPSDVLKKLCAFYNVSSDYLLGVNVTPDVADQVMVLQRAAQEGGLSQQEMADILSYAKYRYPERFIDNSDDHSKET